MKIGIIGAGQIGGTLTRRLTALGHDVWVANSRGPETLSDLAAETGATAVSVPEAVRGVDLVVVTIPEKNIPSLPAGLFANTPDHVVVVDTGNYYPRHRDGRIEAIEGGLPESKWVAQQLGRPVIKAFNNIYARRSAAMMPSVVGSSAGISAFKPISRSARTGFGPRVILRVARSTLRKADSKSVRRAKPSSRRSPSPVINTRSSHAPFTKRPSQASTGFASGASRMAIIGQGIASAPYSCSMRISWPSSRVSGTTIRRPLSSSVMLNLCAVLAHS